MRLSTWVVIGALGAVACASGKDPSAPVGAAPAANDYVGRFVWHDLVTRDVAACRKFYGDLLGWEFETMTRNGNPYLVARADNRFVGGIVERRQQSDKPAAWLAYVAVADIAAALEQVKTAGGQVLLSPTPMGEYGRIAVVLDPQGAPLGLADVTATLPAEPAEPPMRRFFWMEYLAKDGPAALDFYKSLVGYESTVRVTEHGLEYNVLKRQRSRAGLFRLPPQFTGLEPNWLPYVRVEDPAALAARARALGGQVVLEPRADIRKGTLAIITDPTGGAIALQKWPI